MAWFLLIINSISLLIALWIMVFYLIQIFNSLYSMRKLKPPPDTDERNRYAVIIAARNEEGVIAKLIESIKKQDYPSELIDVYVVADNCSDATAARAKECGAVVYERFDKQNVGKSYALDFVLNKIWEDFPEAEHRGYIFFDADNLLNKNYVTELNKYVAQNKYKILTTYRNSKNLGDNWVSHGTGVLFMRECSSGHKARMIWGGSTLLSGTGFFADKSVLVKDGGWKYHGSIEDVEFCVDHFLEHGDLTGYAETAEFYDDQPVSFAQSITQRMRWCKGNHQIFFRYFKKFVNPPYKRHKLARWDLFVFIAPAPFFAISWLLFVSLAYAVCGFLTLPNPAVFQVLGWIWVGVAAFAYFAPFFFGVTLTMSNWKHMKISTAKKIWHLFTFPFYCAAYAPITWCAMFAKAKWKPVKRISTASIDQLEAQKTEKAKKKKNRSK